jgi:Mn2+/Fe2+ NRAMP family transporter
VSPITLLTAVLVASITFSEKIVDVSRSALAAKVLMISCWGLLLLAIVACGAGLALMAAAAGFASYRPELNYHEFEPGAQKLLVTSGLSFGAALVALICAGITSLLSQHT